MLILITFGRFNKLSTEDIQKEKELFLEKKNKLAAFSLYFGYDTAKIKDLKESQIDGIIKEKFLEIKNNLNVYWGFYNFFYDIGICIDLLDDEDKKKILSMNLTYENFGNFASDYYKKFVEKAKKECPREVYECFEDKAFIIYCESTKSQIKKSNFLSFIRNYFILDYFRKFYENYRNNTIFEKIREHMIDLYPILKAEYGRKNIFFDKFMSLFEGDNDYNNKFIKEILNNYNKKIKNDYIKLKQD
jgi:hypothetical protein